MQKLKLTKEEKNTLKKENNESKAIYKAEMKELSNKLKADSVIRKSEHKNSKVLVKQDSKNQKKYFEEINAYKINDKKLIQDRIKEVNEWYESQDKSDKDLKSVYKFKLSKAKRTAYNYKGDIKFENIAYTYSKNSPFEFRALDNTNLTIKDGMITAVIGMTGSGKSTLIQLTNGLILPETGRTIVGNYQIPASTKKIKEVKDLRREIGLVFQFPEYQLFQDTIEKDITFGPINLGGIKKDAIAKVPELLELVDLPADYLKRSPFDLSGGQKRRVAIAGIIAMDGNTLVLDEPTGGLDPQGEEDFMNLFYKLNKEKHKRIIIVTHNMDHVLKIADEVVVMHKGKVIANDTPFNIFSNQKLLEKIEIEPPKLYKLAFKLKQKGIDVTNQRFRTVDELAQVIKQARK